MKKLPVTFGNIFDDAALMGEIDSFVERMLNKDNHIENSARFLSLIDHYEIMEFLTKYWFLSNISALCFAYMMVLEKSGGHLNKQWVFYECLKVEQQ